MHSSERKLTITTEEFQEHVARLHADSNYLFSEEFYSLGPSKPDCTWEHSTLHINKSKNRYQDVVAYDHSRVRLMSIDGVPASNYINANFVDGFEKKHAYIATQAPLNQTIEDFWRMVWEQDARLLVMLTNLMERGRRKCDQYWPHDGEISYGDITVRKLEERKYAFYVHRVFSVTCSSAEICKALGQDRERVRVVRQFHFTDWPDFGVPQERSAMLSFVHLVRRYMQENEGPTVIHCSAGVGRTGTFIVIESQIERINREQSINVYGFLKSIRSQRNFLVQQEVQYIFIHDALVDYIKCGLTAIPVSELETIHNDFYFDPHPDTAVSVIEEEWQIINEFNIHEFEMLTGRRPCNQQKNRDSFIIPVDATRVRLTMKSVTEGTDYVNANYVDSYLQKKAFIVTQMPLHDTIEDFWRMIWENFSQIVVSLLSDEECNKEDFFSYLPRQDCNPVNFGAFEIRCLSEKKLEFYRLRELEVVGRVEGGESERRKVHHYQFLGWQENTLPEIENAFEMISLIKGKKAMGRGTRSASSSPVVVHCSCGIGRSGVFCALSNIKEQMDDFEETIDVFSTVRMLRRQRPLLINSKDFYEYLYRAALRYKEMMPAFPPEEEFQDLHIELTHSPAPFSDDVLNLIENMEEDSDSDVGI
ncbi:receptor-type tyrosine-protein phosphatase delta-like [Rhopilema esculentum]|uniref:receptor-type tyrosine-protein phosphatase delta-like n=1 Tax=Rhopilema esculentum TaxID=499914 RepID=UPI0031D8224A